MKYCVFLLLLITSLLFAACAAGETDFHSRIQGFWKVRQVQNSGETNEMFVQINDSLLLYWYKDVNYIFPFRYRIEDHETLIVWLQNDPESRPTPIGKLSREGIDGFNLINEHQRLEYTEATFEEFEAETGKAWEPLK